MTLPEMIRGALPATDGYGGKSWEEWAEGIAALFEHYTDVTMIDPIMGGTPLYRVVGGDEGE